MAGGDTSGHAVEASFNDTGASVGSSIPPSRSNLASLANSVAPSRRSSASRNFGSEANSTRFAKGAGTSPGISNQVTIGAATEMAIAKTSTAYRVAAEFRRIVRIIAPATNAISANCQAECTSTQPSRSTRTVGIWKMFMAYFRSI
ncbi:MAG: hypothetical protein ACKV0T_09105 [Planctomycetales bacterium]